MGIKDKVSEPLVNPDKPVNRFRVVALANERRKQLKGNATPRVRERGNRWKTAVAEVLEGKVVEDKE